ncbi:MAG: ferredoxin family protein [Mariprofundales bacterium]
MAFVVTRLCRDCVDTACVAVCPVDCFYKPVDITAKHPNQLLISPEECIDCAVCEPECPWEAIYPEEDVPESCIDDIALNDLVDQDTDRNLFELAEVIDHTPPSAEEIAENKQKWNVD